MTEVVLIAIGLVLIDLGVADVFLVALHYGAEVR
jgi:hypothetical protein